MALFRHGETLTVRAEIRRDEQPKILLPYSLLVLGHGSASSVNADRACPWREKTLIEYSFGHILCLVQQYDRKDDDNDNSDHECQDHSHAAGSGLFVHLPAL